MLGVAVGQGRFGETSEVVDGARAALFGEKIGPSPFLHRKGPRPNEGRRMGGHDHAPPFVEDAYQVAFGDTERLSVGSVDPEDIGRKVAQNRHVPEGGMGTGRRMEGENV
jgi:hypothetical protein